MSEDIICIACRDLLPHVVNGHANQHARDLVEQHVATCAMCERELVEWQMLAPAFTHPLPDALPADSVGRVLAQVRAHIVADAPLPAGGSHMAPSATMPRIPTTPIQPLTPPQRARSILVSVGAVLLLSALTAVIFGVRPQPGTTTLPVSAAPVTAAQLAGFDLRGVALPSATAGWAVGGTLPDPHYKGRTSHAPFVRPILLQEQEGKWYRAPVPAGLLDPSMELVSIIFVTPTAGWAIAVNRLPPNSDGLLFSQLLHYDGLRWTVLPTQFPAHLNALAFTAPTNGWAVGEQAGTTSQALVLHFVGTTWQTVQNPAFTNVLLTAVGATGHDVWAAGMDYAHATGPDGNVPEVVLHFDGERWTSTALTPARVRIAAIALAPDGSGWAAGTGPPAATASGAGAPGSQANAVLLHLHGGIWTEQNISGSTPGQSIAGWNALALTAGGTGWVVGSGGARLTLPVRGNPSPAAVAPPDQQLALQGIALRDAADGWAVGAGGMLQLAQGIWQRYTP